MSASAGDPKGVDHGVRQWWRKQIFSAVSEAKRTRCGVPTAGAILARWWIVEHVPTRQDRQEWERSFGCACEVLDLPAAELRARLLRRIDASLQAQYAVHVRSVVYIKRAMVLACAGIPTAISRQYLLPMCDAEDYEDVAGIDHGDQYAMYDQREYDEAYDGNLTSSGVGLDK